MEEKNVNIKLLLKSSFWYTISSYLTKVMVFITMPIFTRLMSKEQYGDFSVFANWQAILVILSGLEVYNTINRARFDFQGYEKLNSYITSSLIISTIFTGLLFIFYIVFSDIFNSIFLLDLKYILIMFAYMFTYPAFAMFQAKQRIEYKYKLSSIITFIVNIIASLLAIILVYWMTSDRLMGRILGGCIPYIIVGFAFYVYFLIQSRQVSIVAWKYAIRMGLPMVFGCLGSQILLSSDTFIVKQMCNAEEVSYISMTHSCSHIILLLVLAINNAYAPWFYDMLKVNNLKIIKKVYIIFLWLVIFCTFSVILLAHELILVLGGKEYMESLSILPGYILCGVFTVLILQLSNLEVYYKKPEYAALFTMIAAVLNIFLNIIGVKIMGYRAVCYSTVLCQIILIALHYIFTVKMGIMELLPYKTMIMSIIISLVMIPGAMVLYDNNTLRYTFIALIMTSIIIGIIIKHEELKTIISRIK